MTMNELYIGREFTIYKGDITLIMIKVEEVFVADSLNHFTL